MAKPQPLPCPHVCTLIFIEYMPNFYTPMGSGVARRDPTHVLSKLVYAYNLLCLSTKGYCQIPFFLVSFAPDMDTEIGMVIYMYFKYFSDHID